MTKSTRSREKRMRALGHSRYRSKQAVAYGQKTGEAKVLPTHFSPERCLMTEAAKRMAENLQDSIDKYLNGSAGKAARSITLLAGIPAEVACVIAARVIIDCLAQNKYYQQIAYAVGQQLREEAMLRALKQADLSRFRHYEGQFIKKRRSRRSRVSKMESDRVLRRLIKAHNMADWPQRDQVRIGVHMLELMHSVSGLIQFRVVGNPTGKMGCRKLVDATPATVEWLKKAHEALAASKPFWLPVDAPPKDWREGKDGGYWTDEIPRIPLIKGVSDADLEQNSKDNCPEVYAAINHLQKSPFVLNDGIYQIAKDLWDSAIDLPCLPRRTDEIPPENPGYAKETEEHRQWRKAAAKIHSRNRECAAQRIQISRTLMVAKEVGNAPFYFPYQMDFRGRVYAVPSFLNPQGDDLARGLLAFRDPVKVDARAMQWLKRHLANTYGYDKATWSQREAWADENRDRILQVASDPMHHLWWAEVDKPWQFLAACMDYASALKDGTSRIPIQIDGSNNGLQLFSLMLLDEEGAFATNCSSDPEPQDIYQRVADMVTARLLDSYEHPFSKAWLEFWGGKIPRNLCKRSVMVLPYGATLHTSLRYVGEYYGSHCMTKRIPPIHETQGYAYVNYLNNIVWQCIGQVVTGARRAMAWLHQVANIHTEANLDVQWNAPTGFFVRHRYPDSRSSTIKTMAGDRYVFVAIRESINKLSKSKQRNALSPNFVHSLDAAVLVKAVNKLAQHNVHQITCVHDSFGVPATQVDLLTQALKDAAVEIFSRNVLEDFANQARLRLPSNAQLPELPQLGKFDLLTLQQSEYFFS